MLQDEEMKEYLHFQISNYNIKGHFGFTTVHYFVQR